MNSLSGIDLCQLKTDRFQQLSCLAELEQDELHECEHDSAHFALQKVFAYGSCKDKADAICLYSDYSFANNMILLMK